MKNYLNFNELRKDIEDALGDVAKKYGIDVSAGNISYDENSATIKLNIARNDVDVAKLNFERDLPVMNLYTGGGFTKNDYLRHITIDKKGYAIVGFKPGKKNDVILRRDDGRECVANHVIVFNALSA